MNKNIVFAALAALLTAGGTARAQSMVKIGTVDMKKIFESYYKTKEVEQRINERRNRSKSEPDEREIAYQKIVIEIKKISEEIENPALGGDAKVKKKQELDHKHAERESMQREITSFRRTREKQLQEESARVRAGIVGDIKEAVMEIVRAENYDIVFDKSGMSLNGVGIVMFAKDTFDFTDSVVSTLNKNRGTESGSVTATTNEAVAEWRLDNREAIEREDFAALRSGRGSDLVQNSTGSIPVATRNDAEESPAPGSPKILPKENASPTRAKIDAESEKYYWIAAFVALIAAGMVAFRMREQRA